MSYLAEGHIIQLRGEPPAHIITPAVHLRKEQVGETFRDMLDMPYTDDIPVMMRQLLAAGRT